MDLTEVFYSVYLYNNINLDDIRIMQIVEYAPIK